MFNDLAYMIFGELDPFFQLFVFEPVVITILALIAAMITKKSWVMAIVIIVLNFIDAGIDANFAFGAEGMGSVIGHTFTNFFSNFFSMFYEFVFSFIIAGLPWMHSKFGIA